MFFVSSNVLIKNVINNRAYTAYAKELHSFYWGKNNHWISDSCIVFPFPLPWGYSGVNSFKRLNSSSLVVISAKKVEFYLVLQINLRKSLATMHNPAEHLTSVSDIILWVQCSGDGYIFQSTLHFLACSWMLLLPFWLTSSLPPAKTKKLNSSFNFRSGAYKSLPMFLKRMTHRFPSG